MFRFTNFISSILILTVLLACSKDPANPDPGDVSNVNGYMTDLPTWDQFSPTEAPQAPMAIGSPDTVGFEMVDVEEIQDDGSIDLIEDVNYVCVETPYNMKDNPERVVMYSPDREILFPGALIQGRSYRDGLGSILGLPIAERTPIRVSIPGLANDDNFRTVENPNQANISQAIGSMIGAATRDSLSTPSTITFEQETYHSDQQFGLSIGVSGRYLGFSASATGNFDRNASETTITAYFYQKMYEVVVEPPQTPGAFFSEAFTSEKLQEQIDLGRIGPDNIPVYVSNVVYGRMMMFSFTSTASETDIRATISAAYNGIGGGGSANLSAQQQTILQQAKIAITSLGGDDDATISMIRSGNWQDYFTSSAPLSSAEPLSYTFRNLSDGSIAKVSEATEFTIRECFVTLASGETFEFLPIQQEGLQINTPVKTLTGDFNNDGRKDFLWNHLGSGGNQFYAALGNGDGTFTAQAVLNYPHTATEGWGLYDAAVGDFNGDGNDDIVWNHTDAGNRTYVGLSDGSGGFSFPDSVEGQLHFAGGWGNYNPVKIGDFNNDGYDDLLWDYHAPSRSRSYVGKSNGDGSFTFLPLQDRIANGWDNYTSYVGDISGDGRDDVVLNYPSSGVNRIYVNRGNSNAQFDLLGLQDHYAQGWGAYTTRLGDVNGDGMTDMLFIDVPNSNGDGGIYKALASGNGLFSFPAYQRVSGANLENPVPYIGDVNGDGRDDIVYNRRDVGNEVLVALGKSDGTHDFTRILQSHREFTDWQQFETYIMDVNGDGFEDIVWNHAAASNRIYVGLAR